MYTKTIVTGAAIAALTSIPHCPAPIGMVPGLVVAALATEAFIAPAIGIGIEYGCGDKCDVNQVKKMKVKRGKWATMMNHVNKRFDLPPGVSQHALDECTQSTSGAHIQITQTDSHSFRIDGVPAPCMNLATLFIDAEDGLPVPCGSACLNYENITDDGKKQLYEAIDQIKG